MKVVVVGANGDMGKAVCEELAARHEVIRAGRSSGDVIVDMSDPASVAEMYDQVGQVDAVVSTAGDSHFAPLAEHTRDTYMIGLTQKVMGQINLVLGGLDKLADGGSFTLTSGVLDHDPVRRGTGPATANGALAGFVVSSAIEMPRGLRINVVSPGLLDVSAKRYEGWFPGHDPVPASKVARLGFAKSVEGAITGQVIHVE